MDELVSLDVSLKYCKTDRGDPQNIHFYFCNTKVSKMKMLLSVEDSECIVKHSF